MDFWALENLCFSGKLLVDCNLAYFISIWKSDIYIILRCSVAVVAVRLGTAFTFKNISIYLYI